MSDIITDLATIRARVKAEEDENIRFRQFVKYRLDWSDRRLDETVDRLATEVEAVVDCTQCANCCRVLEISLVDEDLARLGAHLGLSPAEVTERYAAEGTQCDRAFAHSPCAFLDGDRCSLYPARPRDCREYPHLHKTEFRQRMWHLLIHAEDCPIVFNVLARMKAEIWRRG
jgi:Fe-S-cluster containining protein